jgi:Cys-Gly metallodipeptidase DUG1
MLPLFPLRIPSLARSGQSLLSKFSPSTRPIVPRRFFYGHISDTKMAPQLEPFFKQYVPLVFAAWSMKKGKDHPTHA